MKICKIDPILKARIDNVQDQIEFINEQYALNEKYWRSYIAVYNALINHKKTLVSQI